MCTTVHKEVITWPNYSRKDLFKHCPVLGLCWLIRHLHHMIGVLVKCINFFQLTYLQVCTEQWWWPLVLLLLGLQLLVHVWLLVGQCHWPILTTKLNYFITVCFTVYCVLTCNTKKCTLFHLSVNAWCPLIGGQFSFRFSLTHLSILLWIFPNDNCQSP